MQATYSATAHPDRDLIRISLGGLFRPADVAAFGAVRLAAHTRLTCGPNRHVTLVDLREMMLQTQDVLARFRDMLVDPVTRSRRVALVTGASIVRMQVRRLVNGDDVVCFTDMSDAEAWLAAVPPALKLAG